MNILVVPTSDWIGHALPTRLHYIFETLGKSEDVYVLRLAFENNRKIPTGLPVQEIDDLRIGNPAWYYLLNAHKHYGAVKKIIAEKRIDVVVVSNLLAGYAAVKAAGNAKAVVFDLSDHFPTSGSGYYFDVQSIRGKFAAAFLEEILKKTLRNVDRVVACSHVLLEYVRRLGFLEASLVPNGVHDFFMDAKKRANPVRGHYDLDDSVVVGYVGSIEFWLDMLPLLKALKRLTGRYDVRLMLVGGGLGTKATVKLRSKIREIGLEKQVVWVDFVPYTSVPDYVASMDVCTIPFDHHHPTAYYSSPNKLFEYLALEKPVISTPIPEVVLAAKDCVDFAVSEEDYFGIIRGYIEDPGLSAEKARKGKELAEEHMWSRIAGDYRSLMQDLLSGR